MRPRFLINWLKNASIAQKWYAGMAFLTVLLAIVLLFLWASIMSLSAVRAYVGGEGLWSKAQKDAVYSLQKYGKTHDPQDYLDFQKFLRVNRGDKQARLELEKKYPDLNVAREGFIDGKNHPDDIESMIRLFRWGRDIYYIDRAAMIWEKADNSLLKLVLVGDELHQLISKKKGSKEQLEDILFEIDAINQEITYLEDDFSYTLGQGSRWLEGLVLMLLCGLILILEFIGIYVIRTFSHSMTKSIGAIVDSAAAIAQGDFTVRSPVFSGDELGQLANSFNQMAVQLQMQAAERDLALEDLQKESSFVRVLQNVAVAANEANSFEEAVQIAINEVCAMTHWPIGHLFVVNRDKEQIQLLPTTLWSIADQEKFDQFRQVTEQQVFGHGDGLPGRVFASGKPVWIPNIATENNFPRLKIALEQGIKSAVAFPILSGSTICGVLEFFSDQSIKKDEALLELIYHLGTQLGRVQERVAAANDLSASEEQIRSIVETAYDAFILIDQRGEVIDWNSQAELTFGWKKQEILGQKLSKTIIPAMHRENHDRGINHFNATREGPVLNKRLEMTALHKDGHEFQVEFTISAVQDKNGNNVFASFLRDITERKQAEENLRQAKERAEISEKVKQLFLANMSHEIRTPMNAILGFARILEESELNKEQKEYVSTIRQSGDNLLVILNDILDFSKIEAGKITLEKAKIDLQGMISSTISMLKHKMESQQVKISYSVDPNIPGAIIGDAVRLNQILLNLVSNAVKFTHKGVIHIIAKREQEDDENIIVGFSVEDTGIGIPPDKLQSIFESFTQASDNTTRKFGGTGLGLAIVKQLIELQGGHISVQSEPGKGSIFSFSLPFLKNLRATKESKSEIGISAPSEALLVPDQAKVLLAEDNAINQLLAIKIFSRWGIDLEVADNGLIVLEKLKTAKYDLVLMDLQMPEMDGYQTTTHIRSTMPELADMPIVAMTAHAIKGEKERCIGLGMNDYISKPFDIKELHDLVVRSINASKAARKD